MENIKDKIQGMFMGVFLGDALGFPTEFKCNANVPYTGKLEFKPFYISRFQGKREYEIGSTSDDTEMTLALLRSMIENNGYVRDKVIKSYMDWVNNKDTQSLSLI